ncbi:hypothetical protein CH256_23155 [Rhodococcus sp. 05-2254-6]|nr:MmgE/PrpD family protein [Rhodococcus sp. 05-2254-6]OZE21016.1 hypothetical protein CH256_23155 [Rhodococcus sp. 05-2254-6]
MDGSPSFRSTERTHAVDALATAMVELRKSPLPAPLGDKARLILLDLLGVTLAGARTAEMVELRKKWDAEPGSTYPIGGSTGTTIETAAELDAIASCCLELDEGNKYAAGHPAAHVLPAAIAAATSFASAPRIDAAAVAAPVAPQCPWVCHALWRVNAQPNRAATS